MRDSDRVGSAVNAIEPGTVFRQGLERRVWVRRKPRAVAAIMSMVDLLSCSFGAALFLFVVTFNPAEQRVATPDARSNQGIVRIIATTRSARPIFVLTDPLSGLPPVVVDKGRLKGTTGLREVKDARSNADGGKVFVYGPSPWDLQYGEEKRPLYLVFESPTGARCLRIGILDNDGTGRRDADGEITAIEVSVLKPKSAGMEPVAVTWQSLKSTPDSAVPISSECITVNFD